MKAVTHSFEKCPHDPTGVKSPHNTKLLRMYLAKLCLIHKILNCYVKVNRCLSNYIKQFSIERATVIETAVSGKAGKPRDHEQQFLPCITALPTIPKQTQCKKLDTRWETAYKLCKHYGKSFMVVC